MPDRRTSEPEYSNAKSAMRVGGPILVAVGLICTIIGFSSILSASSDPSPTSTYRPSLNFNGFQRQSESMHQDFEDSKPKLFFFAFIGIPLLGIGASITKVGYLKEITTYTAKETTPAVTIATTAIRSAIIDDDIPCPACATPIEPDSQFCSSCGIQIANIQCPKCDSVLEPADKFCNSCGLNLHENSRSDKG